MEMKELLNKIKDNEKTIIEVFVMSIISGWFLTNIMYRTYKVVENVEYLATFNKTGMIVIIILASIAAAVVYAMHKQLASALMFLSVFVYSLFAINQNNDNIYYAICLVIVSALALTYVRDDLLEFAKKIKINEKAGVVIMAMLGVALIVFIAVITVLRYKTYSNSTFDFGVFAQMFENMRNTGHPTTSVERPEMGSFSHFGVHFSPIFYLMLPFYYLFPSPVTVQVMQAVVLGIAVVPLYFLCRHYQLSIRFSVVMCVVYCIFPAVASGTFYDFHENCCIPVLLFSLILMVEKKKDIWAVVFAISLMMVKEDAAFYLLVLGVYFIFSKRDKKRGIVMSVVAIIYFAVALKIVQSYGSVDLADMRFGHIMYDKEGGLAQIIITFLANPAYVLLQVITEDNLQYFILMILPMGMALLQKTKFSRYILLGTFILINLIPSYTYMSNIGFQYNFGVVVLMMYVAIMTVSEWEETKKNHWLMTSFVVTMVLFVGFTFHKWETYTDRYEANKGRYIEMDKALNLIPDNASVLTSGFIMPHLYYVEDLTVIRGEYEIDQDFVVVDMREGYSTDIEEVGPKLVEYTMIYEVTDVIRVYAKD